MKIFGWEFRFLIPLFNSVFRNVTEKIQQLIWSSEKCFRTLSFTLCIFSIESVQLYFSRSHSYFIQFFRNDTMHTNSHQHSISSTLRFVIFKFSVYSVVKQLRCKVQKTTKISGSQPDSSDVNKEQIFPNLYSPLLNSELYKMISISLWIWNIFFRHVNKVVFAVVSDGVSTCFWVKLFRRPTYQYPYEKKICFFIFTCEVYMYVLAAEFKYILSSMWHIVDLMRLDSTQNSFC